MNLWYFYIPLIFMPEFYFVWYCVTQAFFLLAFALLYKNTEETNDFFSVSKKLKSLYISILYCFLKVWIQASFIFSQTLPLVLPIILIDIHIWFDIPYAVRNFLSVWDSCNIINTTFRKIRYLYIGVTCI